MSKREHFRRAREHLDSGEDSRLNYAALELRLCIEEIVYSKLQTYAKRLPDEVKKKWQPPQALKALLEIEPNADRPFILRKSRHVEPGVPGSEWRNLGTHRTVSLKWLKKNYNRLGSYLHASMPFVPPKHPWHVELKERRESLESITKDLEPAVKSTMDASLGMVVVFECGACDSPVACNEEGLENTGRAVCLHPDCGVEHEALRAEDGEWVFQIPAIEVRCHLCQSHFWVQEHLLTLGLRVSCKNCDAKFVVQWMFGLESETPERAQDEGGSGGS